MQTENLKIAEEACGTEASEYLSNKHRGGNSGGKGVFYETLFAVFNAALLVSKSDGDDALKTNLSTQTLDFVDDFVISRCEDSSRKHFQLKNTDNVSWGTGNHPIAGDFRLQKRLNDALGVEKTSATLVLPFVRKARKLQESIPDDISDFSAVDQFSFGETLNHALQAEPKLRDALSELCVNADYDKIEKLGALFIGEWASRSGEPCSLNDLWEGVLRHQPNYVKSGKKVDIIEKFTSVLMQISGFHYTIDQGFFEWSYMESDSGIFEHPVDSEEFYKFQKVIASKEPSTFEELERHLI